MGRTSTSRKEHEWPLRPSGPYLEHCSRRHVRHPTPAKPMTLYIMYDTRQCYTSSSIRRLVLFVKSYTRAPRAPRPVGATQIAYKEIPTRVVRARGGGGGHCMFDSP